MQWETAPVLMRTLKLPAGCAAMLTDAADEAAELLCAQDEHKRLMAAKKVLVIGGGIVGVELAGARGPCRGRGPECPMKLMTRLPHQQRKCISNRVCNGHNMTLHLSITLICAGEIVTNLPDKEVVVVCAGDHLIPDKPSSIGKRALDYLQNRGAKVGSQRPCNDALIRCWLRFAAPTCSSWCTRFYRHALLIQSDGRLQLATFAAQMLRRMDELASPEPRITLTLTLTLTDRSRHRCVLSGKRWAP